MIFNCIQLLTNQFLLFGTVHMLTRQEQIHRRRKTPQTWQGQWKTVACVYAVMPGHAGQFLGEGGNRGKSTQVTQSEANQVTLSQTNKSASAQTEKPPLKTSALTCASSLHGELSPAKVWSSHARPSQVPRDDLPPALDSCEASGVPCASLAAQPGSRCPGQPSPWRSRRTRCGPRAGRGNSASPDAWGGEKSVYLQHRFENFNLIKCDTAFSFPLNHCTCCDMS